MKLIRITSNNPEGRFETLFKTDINIKENSKIGLKSATFSTHKEYFVIDGNNNKIQFQYTNTGTVQEIFLNNATYNLQNTSLLFKDFTDKLNDGIVLIGKTIGLQFLVDVNRQGNFSLQYKFSPFVLETKYYKSTNISITSTGINNKNIKSSQALDVLDDSSIFHSIKPFTKGSGLFRVKMTTFLDSGVNGNGLYFGLTRTDPSKFDTPVLTVNQKDLYIRVNRDGANGGFYEVGYLDKDNAGYVLTTPIVPEVNDFIEIQREQGNFKLVIHKGNTDHLLFTYNDKDDSDYFPYVIMRSNDTHLRLQNIRIQLNPYSFDSLLTEEVSELNTGLELSKHNPRPERKTINTVTFPSLPFMEFLGFDITNGNLSRVIQSKEPNFLSEKLFLFSIFNDTYLVVLDNLELESYDGFDGVRRSILEVIPAEDREENSIIEYQPNNINFINLKLPRKVNIRNIKGRILKSNLDPANLKGMLNLTLLINEN